ncbi:MAG: DUF5702 domain-containing protein [Eubacterium sp.]|nr:DUF5702 domain-containing protein [Eubacterium sp.]MDD7208964.1 DUF5702 domain-containing protein [Lachnospiraceae bacterium]MDY5496613.1 DUF5702 domain-containing protein [Anaerobutyricum sp.]
MYLSLIFLVLLGFGLCILKGIQAYGTSSLGEDAMKNAGENILANYDKELFEQYHLFFLDPREKKYILSDGKNYMNHYFDSCRFYNAVCTALSLEGENRAVDKDGLYIKHQIREIMKYQEKEEVDEKIKTFVPDMIQGKKEVQEDLRESGEEAGQNARDNTVIEGGSGEDQKQDGKTQKEQLRWRDIRETLQLVMKSGILFYVVDDPEKISGRTIAGRELPSDLEKVNRKENGINFSTLFNLKELHSLLSEETMFQKDGPLWKEDYCLLSYADQYFQNYGEEKGKEKVLLYEKEYLLCGKETDRENLKKTAEKLLLFRFIINYICASHSPQIREKADAVAVAAAGFMGVPQAVKPAQIIVLSTLSFGESLLEIHALLSGKAIPVLKDESTWNLSFETAVAQLRNKSEVKTGKWNGTYKDFIKILMLCEGESKGILYRMMDIMQENIALKEPDFLMGDALFSFRWKGVLSGAGININFSRKFSY